MQYIEKRAIVISCIFIFILCAIIYSFPVRAAPDSTGNCENVSVMASLPSEINITNIAVGQVIGTGDFVMNATCTSYTLKPALWRYINTISWGTNAPDHTRFKLPEQTGSLWMEPRTGGLNQGAASEKYNWLAWVYIPRSVITYQYGSPVNFRLREKKVGLTIVNYSDFHGDFLNANVGAADGYEVYHPEDIYPIPISYSRNTDTLRLINMATCNASVNDVTFPGQVSASAIAAGTEPSQRLNIDIGCDGVLPKYTISVSSLNGTFGDPQNGIIKSNNPTIGYRLDWSDSQVATGNVQLDMPLTPANTPTSQNFSVPISVTPVSLVGTIAGIQAGESNSSVKIDLIFN